MSDRLEAIKKLVKQCDNGYSVLSDDDLQWDDVRWLITQTLVLRAHLAKCLEEMEAGHSSYDSYHEAMHDARKVLPDV